MNKEERVEKLKYLIDCLEEENTQYRGYIPEDNEQSAFNLYRALCNVRMPLGETGHTLPERFYTLQAEVLQDMTEKKGIIDVTSLPAVQTDERISLWQGDITTLKADAIVNAANSKMLGCFQPLHGCIDNMIHTMAGVELREECYRLMMAQGHEEETGQAKITKGYNLPSKHVLHTVGPIVMGPLTERHKQLLASCYRSCLSLGDENHLHSIVFCCISTGVFMFPQDKAAEIAVKTVKEYLDEHPDTSVKRIVFNVFKDSDYQIYDALLNRKIRIHMPVL